MQTPTQPNYTDCGVYTLRFAQVFLRTVDSGAFQVRRYQCTSSQGHAIVWFLCDSLTNCCSTFARLSQGVTTADVRRYRAGRQSDPSHKFNRYSGKGGCWEVAKAQIPRLRAAFLGIMNDMKVGKDQRQAYSTPCTDPKTALLDTQAILSARGTGGVEPESDSDIQIVSPGPPHGRSERKHEVAAAAAQGPQRALCGALLSPGRSMIGTAASGVGAAGPGGLLPVSRQGSRVVVPKKRPLDSGHQPQQKKQELHKPKSATGSGDPTDKFAFDD